MSGLRTLAVILFAAAVGQAGCSAQPARPLVPLAAGDTLAVQLLSLAFEDARSLALDAQGMLYVTDAGASTVIVLSANGVPLRTLGGPGTGDYAFLGPADLDPTNGLVLTVADTGNGRIQRFSRDGRLLDTLPVPTGRNDRAGQPFGTRDTAGDDRRLGQGRPVAVASAVTGELFVVEETEGVVLRFDDRRDFDRVVGGMDAGEGALRTPIGLALGPEGRLFVADRGRAAVLVYDAFGQYLRRIGNGQLAGVVAVAVVGERLAVVLPHTVRLYDLDGRLLATLAIPTDEPLVDVAGTTEALYLLTPTRLFRSETPSR